MENKFLNSFYSSLRIVSIMELTDTQQFNEEPVIDVINRWCELSLKCKDHLPESSAVKICA